MRNNGMQMRKMSGLVNEKMINVNFKNKQIPK